MSPKALATALDSAVAFCFRSLMREASIHPPTPASAQATASGARARALKHSPLELEQINQLKLMRAEHFRGVMREILELKSPSEADLSELCLAAFMLKAEWFPRQTADGSLSLRLSE